jgi:hypothetical protein
VVLLGDHAQQRLVRSRRDVVQDGLDAGLRLEKRDGLVAMRAIGMNEDV